MASLNLPQGNGNAGVAPDYNHQEDHEELKLLTRTNTNVIHQSFFPLPSSSKQPLKEQELPNAYA